MTQAGLSISQLAERTGLAAATLRMWESRYAFPAPRRLESGHRRYSVSDVERVREVVRRRDAGLSLAAAVARVADAAPEEESVFAALRRRHADLVPQRVRKRELTMLSRAIEDECSSRGDRGVLVGAFQHERFYRLAEPRWRDMARTAGLSVVFADFARVRRPAGAPAEVPIAGDRPAQREWVLLYDSPAHSACLAGWELPGQAAVADGARVFECVWTVAPRAVADGLEQAARMAAIHDGELGRALAARVDHDRPGASPEVALATAITTRMLAYAGENASA